ncbi:MAG: Zn-dependent hydrolase [Candidatus Dactylopiibacterium carminicum]|uniref:Zn-dependent hydrolase n=1 Tax=Candidatus Dactylopiibacterium carminicum TaxID=857335 RepID=A0A272EVQ6_9RHOO|nr:M20/M25/M40 family metallo-hydrolase [Candidatus Dactylopiibacterium carminicum]KAF7599868.1 Zn-dependent hydrolase [Candidatus Dactylopiibacterium carminicum]PAS94193.1 MAG: Zn-dependent hydrolase [Candidatus Dactylopiibacterium carminicum]PAS96735.1 MAG: Zn-dependent hydrolase [Candidatus Dactylopiibacterium carminicum]PAS99868.1 MAG: Zn-dependent hydrolase [Candidatus Dactylopiibacterium carminicum]
MKTQETLALTILEDIAALSRDGEGITRESYGEGEERAMQAIEAHAHALGFACERDRFQNLWMRLPNDARSEPPVVIGSHMDSVPQGGNYDGLAGVLAGMLVLDRLRDDPQAAPPVRVLALRGEESAWYGKAYVGSLALLGKLPASALALRHRSGQGTLGEAMARSGVDVDAVARGWPSTVVTGIRGNIRHTRVRCLGETGHSGAVPRWLRHDAVLATADLLSRMDEHWRVLLQMGMDLVMTLGICTTPVRSHAVSVIPGEVEFSFEVRSQDADTLERFHALMQEECRAVEKARGVRFEFDKSIRSAPARMDEAWIGCLEQAAETRGTPVERLPSGAGHDAAVFANAGIPAAMVFVRNAHGSHNVHEAMECADFLDGVDLLCRALLAA